jgi:hypothetical protein
MPPLQRRESERFESSEINRRVLYVKRFDGTAEFMCDVLMVYFS